MSEIVSDNGFPPLSSLRLIVPPLQLVSAALLEIVKQGAVMYFGLLEEFITTVLETAPELLTDTERLQLVIGLRAKVVLEMCRSDTLANQQALELRLSQLNTYITDQDKKTPFPALKASVTDFLRLVHTIMEDESQKRNFYQNTFSTVFGPKYDSSLHALMKKFLFNLQELLPIPTFKQISLWLSVSPSVTKDCVDFMNQTKPLKTLIQHHKHRGHTITQALSSTLDDCILSSLSYNLSSVNNEGDAAVKPEPEPEPICNLQDLQPDDSLSSESKQDSGEYKQASHSGFRGHVEGCGQQSVDNLSEDQGASVEVTLPPFDENDSNDDDDDMDEAWFSNSKTGRRASAKKFNCHVCGKDFGSQGNLNKHKITHTAPVTKRMSQKDSASQSSPFEKLNLHLLQRTSSENDASSLAGALTQNQTTENSPLKSEQSSDDFSPVCQEQQESKCLRSSALHSKSNPVIKINRSLPLEMASIVPQDLISLDSPQDQTCKRSSRVKQCSVCREIFPSSSDLMRHMRCHTEQSTVCSHCGEDFDSYEDCKTHEERECGASKQHSDDSSMSSENEMSEDISATSSEISQVLISKDAPARSKVRKPILTCPKCGQHFTYCKRFEEHLKKCTGTGSKVKERTSTSYVIIKGCDFSSAGNTNESQAETSSERKQSQTETAPSTTDNAEGSQNKNRIYKCTICAKSVSKIALMRKHYSESHNIRGPYPCTLCKTTFVRLCELFRHQQNKQLFICLTCKKGFRLLGELRSHENVHSETAPFVCETCGRGFRLRTNLIMHQRKHQERPPVVCSYCGKGFKTKNRLKAHMVRHTEGFPCPICGKVFYQNTYLKYHLYKHTGEQPYLCDTCGKGWPTPAQLKIHMVQHREDRPYKCDDCGVTYKRESHLITHQKSKHGSSRPFACNVCSMAFRINSHLKKHMMVHSGERPFSCTICGKTFKEKFQLRKHRRKPCL